MISDDELICCKDDSILPESPKACSEYASLGFSCAPIDKCNDEAILASGQARLSDHDIDSFAMEDNPHDGQCDFANANEVCCSSIIDEKPAAKCDEDDGYQCIPLQVRWF